MGRFYKNIQFAISSARAKTLRRMFFPGREYGSTKGTSHTIQQLREAGLVDIAPGRKHSLGKKKIPVRITEAGKIRLQVMRINRLPSVDRLSSVMRIRTAKAFLIDLIHGLRLAKQEAYIRHWLGRPKESRPNDVYAYYPRVTPAEVKAVLQRVASQDNLFEVLSSIKNPPEKSIDDLPVSIQSELREQQNRQKLAKWGLRFWEEPRRQGDIFGETRRIWEEAILIQRDTRYHQRLAQHLQ